LLLQAFSNHQGCSPGVHGWVGRTTGSLKIRQRARVDTDAQMREYEGNTARVPVVCPCPKGVGQVEDADRARARAGAIAWQERWPVFVVATKALLDGGRLRVKLSPRNSTARCVLGHDRHNRDAVTLEEALQG
jgi:hypothetical protein